MSNGTISTHCEGVARLPGEALAAHRLVKSDINDKAVYADAADRPEGVVDVDVDATDVSEGNHVNVKLLDLSRETVIVTASEPMARGVACYAAADGKVQTDTAGTVLVGNLLNKAANIASADGDLVEMIPARA